MKTFGVMALGVVLYLAFSRLSTDSIGMFLGLVVGLGIGVFVLVGVIIGHGLQQNRQWREDERRQPPVIIMQQPASYIGQGRQYELPQQGGFEVVERHDQGSEWR